MPMIITPVGVLSSSEESSPHQIKCQQYQMEDDIRSNLNRFIYGTHELCIVYRISNGIVFSISNI